MPYANTGSVCIAPKRMKPTINSASANAARKKDDKRKPLPVITTSTR